MKPIYQNLGNGIYCIDTKLNERIGLAACYLIREGDQAAFIDTGTYHTVPYLLAVLEQEGLTPQQVRYIIPTHIHLDHGGGAGELMRHCPDATLVIHPKGAAHMIDPSRLQAGASAVYGEAVFERNFGKLIPVPEERVVRATEGYTVTINGRKLSFWDTPGHANHHGCIFDHQTAACFTGDTFGIAYREFDNHNGAFIFATTTPVAFDPDAWESSLDKLAGLQPQSMLLTHYGPVTEVERLSHDLRQSVRTMKQIALDAENTEPAVRQQHIRTQVMHHFKQQLTRHECKLPEAEIERLLDMDADLNAQGLEVWLQRRAKARERAPHKD